MGGSPYYWAVVAGVTVAFALFDINALSNRRIGRLHSISIVAYAASFALVGGFWAYAPRHGPVEWLFPAAIRIAAAVILVGSRAIASAFRLERRIADAAPTQAEKHESFKGTLTPQELQAAEAFDTEWHEKERQHDRDLRHPRPEQHSETQFEHLVQSAVDELPVEIRSRMSNVAVVVEDEPPPGQRLLGLYHGIPLTWRSRGYAGALPDKITIYRGPIERRCNGDIDDLRREVAHVVRHEIAHHFGISDQRLVDIGRY